MLSPFADTPATYYRLQWQVRDPQHQTDHAIADDQRTLAGALGKAFRQTPVGSDGVQVVKVDKQGNVYTPRENYIVVPPQYIDPVDGMVKGRTPQLIPNALR